MYYAKWKICLEFYLAADCEILELRTKRRGSSRIYRHANEKFMLLQKKKKKVLHLKGNNTPFHQHTFLALLPNIDKERALQLPQFSQLEVTKIYLSNCKCFIPIRIQDICQRWYSWWNCRKYRFPNANISREAWYETYNTIKKAITTFTAYWESKC